MSKGFFTSMWDSLRHSFIEIKEIISEKPSKEEIALLEWLRKPHQDDLMIELEELLERMKDRGKWSAERIAGKAFWVAIDGVDASLYSFKFCTRILQECPAMFAEHSTGQFYSSDYGKPMKLPPLSIPTGRIFSWRKKKLSRFGTMMNKMECHTYLDDGIAEEFWQYDVQKLESLLGFYARCLIENDLNLVSFFWNDIRIKACLEAREENLQLEDWKSKLALLGMHFMTPLLTHRSGRSAVESRSDGVSFEEVWLRFLRHVCEKKGELFGGAAAPLEISMWNHKLLRSSKLLHRQAGYYYDLDGRPINTKFLCRVSGEIFLREVGYVRLFNSCHRGQLDTPSIEEFDLIVDNTDVNCPNYFDYLDSPVDHWSWRHFSPHFLWALVGYLFKRRFVFDTHSHLEFERIKSTKERRAYLEKQEDYCMIRKAIGHPKLQSALSHIFLPGSEEINGPVLFSCFGEKIFHMASRSAFHAEYFKLLTKHPSWDPRYPIYFWPLYYCGTKNMPYHEKAGDAAERRVEGTFLEFLSCYPFMGLNLEKRGASTCRPCSIYESKLASVRNRFADLDDLIKSMRSEDEYIKASRAAEISLYNMEFRGRTQEMRIDTTMLRSSFCPVARRIYEHDLYTQYPGKSLKETKVFNELMMFVRYGDTPEIGMPWGDYFSVPTHSIRERIHHPAAKKLHLHDRYSIVCVPDCGHDYAAAHEMARYILAHPKVCPDFNELHLGVRQGAYPESLGRTHRPLVKDELIRSRCLVFHVFRKLLAAAMDTASNCLALLAPDFAARQKGTPSTAVAQHCVTNSADNDLLNSTAKSDPSESAAKADPFASWYDPVLKHALQDLGSDLLIRVLAMAFGGELIYWRRNLWVYSFKEDLEVDENMFVCREDPRHFFFSTPYEETLEVEVPVMVEDCKEPSEEGCGTLHALDCVSPNPIASSSSLKDSHASQQVIDSVPALVLSKHWAKMLDDEGRVLRHYHAPVSHFSECTPACKDYCIHIQPRAEDLLRRLLAQRLSCRF